MTKPVIQLTNVCKSFGMPEQDIPSTSVLNNLSLSVDHGDAVAITGPSGSGKSTLLNIIGSLDKADSGQVDVVNQNLNELPDNELAAIRLQHIGFVFQLHHLLPQCTVLENVLIPTLPDANAMSSSDAATRAKELLQRLGLEKRMHHHPGQLSGGERQRVAVARALINQPKLILADEPTGSLDRHAADQLAELLLKLNQDDGITLLVVTHSSKLASMMKRELKLENGQLV